MLSKFKLFESFSRLGYRKIANFVHKDYIHIANGLHYFSCNGVCTMVESTHTDDSISMTESPELSNWIKFSENGHPLIGDSDDDFVIPAIADWVENHKLLDHSKVVGKSKLSETDIDRDVENISKILKTRYLSPDEAAKAISGCIAVNISEDLVQLLLKRFSNDWIPAFGVFKWAMLQSGYKHSPDLYNYMVDILGKAKKFNLMWELVEEMLRLDAYVTLDTISKIMRRFSKAGKVNEAIEAFRRMQEFGVKKDVHAMNILMDALAKESTVEDAQKVFLEFKNDIPPDSSTFNILIHGWCKTRKLNDARKAWEEMEKHGVKPTAVSYTCFIEAYCREKDYQRVYDTLDEMQEVRCPPTVVTYTIVMQSLGKSKEIRQALQIYERMKHNGCVPDVNFYSSLIYILSLAGRLKDAQEVFEDLARQGVPPDVLTYNTMISVACYHSQEETALNLLRKMEQASCKPNLKTYSPLLKMCGRKKRMKVLSFLLNHMLKNDISLEVGTYSFLVHVLCKSGKLEHACLFFEEMVLKGFTPKDCTYKLLMEKLEAKSMGKAKGQIENLMLQVKERENSKKNNLVIIQGPLNL